MEQIVQNQKTTSGKNDFHHRMFESFRIKLHHQAFSQTDFFFYLYERMYESSRKSYINMLSRVILIFETWLYRRKMFRIKKNNWNFFIHIKKWLNYPGKLTLLCYHANYRFFRIDFGTKVVKKSKNNFLKIWPSS